MIKVTGLPSGQWFVWALHSFTRSLTVTAVTVFALFDTRARSRAAASEALLNINANTLRVLRNVFWYDNAPPPPADNRLRLIVLELSPPLNVNKVHVPLEPIAFPEVPRAANDENPIATESASPASTATRNSLQAHAKPI